MICPQCGKEFEPKPHAAMPIYCSKKCGRLWRRDHPEERIERDYCYKELKEHLRRHKEYSSYDERTKEYKYCCVCGKTMPKKFRTEGREMLFCSLRCGYIWWEVWQEQRRKPASDTEPHPSPAVTPEYFDFFGSQDPHQSAKPHPSPAVTPSSKGKAKGKERRNVL